MISKNIQSRGMQNGRSQLTYDNIISMRSDFQAKEENLKELSDEYDIHYNTARNAVQGKSWKELPIVE